MYDIVLAGLGKGKTRRGGARLGLARQAMQGGGDASRVFPWCEASPQNTPRELMPRNRNHRAGIKRRWATEYPRDDTAQYWNKWSKLPPIKKAERALLTLEEKKDLMTAVGVPTAEKWAKDKTKPR